VHLHLLDLLGDSQAVLEDSLAHLVLGLDRVKGKDKGSERPVDLRVGSASDEADRAVHRGYLPLPYHLLDLDLDLRGQV
jgi:hypothetical protein